MELGDFTQALELLLAAAHWAFSKQSLAANRGDEGIVRLHLGEFAEATRLFREAERLAAEVGEHRTQANNLENLALAHLVLGEPHKAKDYIDRALTFRVEVVSKYNTCLHLVTRARVLLTLGDCQAAVRDCEAAIDLQEVALRYQPALYMAVGYRYLSDLQTASKAAQQALEWLRPFLTHATCKWDLRYFAGIAFLCTGQVDQSLHAFGEALSACSAPGVVRNVLVDLALLQNTPQPPQGVRETVALLHKSLEESSSGGL